MRYVAAYMLCVLGGNIKPTADDVRTVLGSVGIESDDERLSIVMKCLEGKNVEELIEQGADRLVSLCTESAPAVVAENVPSTDKDKEDEKNENKAESDDDSDDETGMFDLFG